MDNKSMICECDHKYHRYGIHIFTNGTEHLKMLCLNCWNKFSLKKDTKIVGKLYSWNDELSQLLEEYQQRQHEENKLKLQQDYRMVYLKSEHWKITRSKIFDRDRGLCQLCLHDGIEEIATEVHHYTYKNIGNEYPCELISVCRYHHNLYHS